MGEKDYICRISVGEVRKRLEKYDDSSILEIGKKGVTIYSFKFKDDKNKKISFIEGNNEK